MKKRFSEAASALWAKKSKYPAAGGESLWLPLHSHMSDAAETARHLWDDWLPKGTKKAIASGVSPSVYGEGDFVRARQVFVFLAAAHDLGKASPAFQSKGVPSMERLNEFLRQNIRGAGLCLEKHSEYQGNASTYHSLVSHLILERRGYDESVSVVAGAHHGKPPDVGQVRDCALYERGCGSNDENWKSVQKELLDHALALAGLEETDAVKVTLEKTVQVLLSGLVILTDWISSDEKLFPLVDAECFRGAEDSSVRARRAWGELNLTPFWETAQDWDGLFGRRFKFARGPLPLQKTLLETVETCLKPGIVVVEAPMGGGKTEAALAAAEVLAHLTGRGGLLFALPTQATSDAMFGRILKWIERLGTGEKHSVLLAHGKADFNEAYREIERFGPGSMNGALMAYDKADFNEIYQKIGLSENTHVGDTEDGEDVVVHEWLSGRKKSLLADFVIGTIDQLLLAGLKQKHLMLRHLGLANKVVVIDECHAYDTYMSRYLFKVLSWLGAYGTPVIVLSATLPSEKRKQLIDAYLNKIEKDDYDPLFDNERKKPETPKWSLSREYPLITYSDGKEIKQKSVAGEKRQRTVSIRCLNDEAIADTLEESLSGGGCAGVVVNTVRRAQEFYDKISERFGRECVRLLHSRFIAPDRSDKEKELLEMLGSDGTKRPEKLIVIGTQVLEQSLDLDFDLLITDLCPMDLLIQRIGRQHRHDRPRPKKLRNAVCYVLGVNGEDFEGGSKKIYGEYLLMRTKAFLPAEITLPDSIPTLVQDVYDEKKDALIDSADRERYEAAREEKEKRSKSQERRACAFQIPSPPSSESSDTLVGWLDTDVSEGKGEAHVRDGADSLEVIVIQKIRDTLRLLPWIRGGAEIPRGQTPDEHLARALSGCRLRLPSELDAKWLLDDTIKKLEAICAEEHLEEWQKSKWLRGELFLILDEACKTELCGCQLEYDRDKGLISRRLERQA
ncbi:MAG: CRISPR-associated helicase Cas3' [Synergistaceae bacterium]|jgi:CRISPR-associated endonuclease/helicase Cas3|nr:CRISPR-associated helicase Cas3' [Synergistaceae bacterium]